MNSRSWEATSLSFSRYSFTFIIPEGSLRCSQELATGLYPDSEGSSPHYHSYFSL